VIVVVFEFEPDPERGSRYFELARALREEVARIDGFLGVERFESLQRPGRFVSLSYWRDLEAVARWKRHPAHVRAQAEGLRAGLFRDFRITVAEVRSRRTLAEVRARRAEESGPETG